MHSAFKLKYGVFERLSRHQYLTRLVRLTTVDAVFFVNW